MQMPCKSVHTPWTFSTSQLGFLVRNKVMHILEKEKKISEKCGMPCINIHLFCSYMPLLLHNWWFLRIFLWLGHCDHPAERWNFTQFQDWNALQNFSLIWVEHLLECRQGLLWFSIIHQCSDNSGFFSAWPLRPSQISQIQWWWANALTVELIICLAL